MTKVAGICAICGRTGVDVYRCSICGAPACSKCFVQDAKVCINCVRKGLWVAEKEEGSRGL